MKLTTTLTTAILGIALALGLNACSDHDHDAHGGHGDGKDAGHSKADHDGHEKGEKHGEGDTDAGHEHEHEKSIPGPNGGRLITEVEPHLEFLVTDDRKVRISAVSEDNKSTIAIAAQSVCAVAGDRSNPTHLAFAADGETLLSDVSLPEGNDFPLVLQINTKPGAETIREKFNVNLKDCPTCDYKEYACICGHDDDEGEHEHQEEKK